MTKLTTPQQALAAIAAGQKALAGHSQPLLIALSSKVDALDLTGLAADLDALVPLMTEGPLRTALAGYAKALPALPRQIAAAIKQTQTTLDA